MKQFILALCIALLATCSGNHSKNPSPTSAEEVEGLADSVLAAMLKAAPAKLAENIVRLLPEDCLPAPGEEGIQILLQEREQGHPCHIEWQDISEDLITSGICMRALPCKGGDWLVTYQFFDGGDFRPNPPRAFRYRDNTLTEIDWPIEKPHYEDFANGMVESMAFLPRYLDQIRDHLTVRYDYPDWARDDLEESLYSDQDSFFEDACRTNEYHWNGERFVRRVGRFPLVGEEAFGPFRLGKPLDQTPRGFSFQGKSDYLRLVEDASGEEIAAFTLDIKGNVKEIEVRSPQYRRNDGLFPGILLDAVVRKYRIQADEIKTFTRDKESLVFYYRGLQMVIPRSAVLEDGSLDMDAPVRSLLVTHKKYR